MSSEKIPFVKTYNARFIRKTTKNSREAQVPISSRISTKISEISKIPLALAGPRVSFVHFCCPIRPLLLCLSNMPNFLCDINKCYENKCYHAFSRNNTDN